MFDNRKVLSAVLAASMSTMLIPAAAFAADPTDQIAEDSAIETLAGGGLSNC
jgi:hypothetical protein